MKTVCDSSFVPSLKLCNIVHLLPSLRRLSRKIDVMPSISFIVSLLIRTFYYIQFMMIPYSSILPSFLNNRIVLPAIKRASEFLNTLLNTVQQTTFTSLQFNTTLAYLLNYNNVFVNVGGDNRSNRKRRPPLIQYGWTMPHPRPKVAAPKTSLKSIVVFVGTLNTNLPVCSLLSFCNDNRSEATSLKHIILLVAIKLKIGKRQMIVIE